MRWLASITDPVDVSLSRLWEVVMGGSLACCGPRGRRVGTTERLSNQVVSDQHRRSGINFSNSLREKARTSLQMQKQLNKKW